MLGTIVAHIFSTLHYAWFATRAYALSFIEEVKTAYARFCHEEIAKCSYCELRCKTINTWEENRVSEAVISVIVFIFMVALLVFLHCIKSRKQKNVNKNV